MVPHKPDRLFQSLELTRQSDSNMENAAPFLVTAASCYPAVTHTYWWQQSCCRPGGYSCIHQPAKLRLTQEHRLQETPFCGGSENKVANLLQCMNYTACNASSVHYRCQLLPSVPLQPYRCQVNPQKSENIGINITPVLRITDHYNCLTSQ